MPWLKKYSFALFAFLLCVTLGFASIVQASEPTWVLDEQQVLQPRIKASLTRILKEAANTHQAYVQVLLLKEPPQDIQKAIRQNRMVWETYHPDLHDPKAALLVVNAQTGESWVILENNRQKDLALQNSLDRVQSQLILPMIQRGHLEKGLIEGTVGVITLLGGGPVVKNYGPSPFYLWLKEHHLLPWIKFLSLLAFGFAVWHGFNRLFTQPSGQFGSSQEPSMSPLM